MELQIRNLVVHFNTLDGSAQVLDKVNILVAKQQVVGLIGETGCGKSVTVKTILGALPIPPGKILEGSIVIHGQDLLSMNSKQRSYLVKQNFSYIPQDPMSSLNPVFTIGEQIIDLIKWRDIAKITPGALLKSLSRSVYKSARRKVIESLREVNIPTPEDVLDRYPFELSGGMRQRVLIALSLIRRSHFLISDEPTTSLDTTIQKGIIELLQQKISEERLSALYITHNLGVAKILCDKICVMYGGTVVEEILVKGSFLKKFQHPYSKGLIRAVPKLSAKDYQGIKGKVPNYYAPPSGCRFHPRCDYTTQICKKRKPILTEVEKGHSVACFLYHR